MFPEIVKIKVEDEINGFETTTLERLFNSFDSIESEAAAKRKAFIDSKARNFNPDIDDEGCIQEDAYFEELNYIFIEQNLKQEFLNSTATWLFHLFERQKKRVLGSDKTDILKPKLAADGYVLDSCHNWSVLNKELRMAANAIKHGQKSDAARKLSADYPDLVDRDGVKLSKHDIERYINALRMFWEKALNGKVVI
ncbi:hypothetical protein C7R88_03655 [Plesiomonas shigelloides]|uniref:hypothetical protein n=1 Tax=Plesiomonas shigelloides TaxID=703 RepID=UPI000D12E7A2|nr:hypothetical protein [Plesiomonas shigelloides]AVQ86487.1 hypothetical protein C7R88_03655 [Plesiomonas shigelloides]